MPLKTEYTGARPCVKKAIRCGSTGNALRTLLTAQGMQDHPVGRSPARIACVILRHANVTLIPFLCARCIVIVEPSSEHWSCVVQRGAASRWTESETVVRERDQKNWTVSELFPR